MIDCDLRYRDFSSISLSQSLTEIVQSSAGYAWPAETLCIPPPLSFFFFGFFSIFFQSFAELKFAQGAHTHTHKWQGSYAFGVKELRPKACKEKLGGGGGGGRGQKNSGKRNESPCHVFCHKHKPASITTKTPTHPMQTNAGNAKQSSCPFITINTSRQLRLDRGPSTLRPPALLHTSAHPLPLVPHDHTSSWY